MAGAAWPNATLVDKPFSCIPKRDPATPAAGLLEPRSANFVLLKKPKTEEGPSATQVLSLPLGATLDFRLGNRYGAGDVFSTQHGKLPTRRSGSKPTASAGISTSEEIPARAGSPARAEPADKQPGLTHLCYPSEYPKSSHII